MADPRRWLIIPVEVQVRELLSRLLLAALAADRGYDVLIGHDRVVRRLARHLPKGILFDKSLGASGETKVARYRNFGYSVAAIDEESTGFYPNPDLYLTTRLSAETLNDAKRWFCLSGRLRDEATARYPGHSDKFVVTGLPRTDIWRSKFHGLYEAERREIQRQHGDFLLFNSNFGSIIHARSGAFIANQSRRHDHLHSSAAAYRQLRDAQGRQNLDAYVEMLPKLRAWFPDRKLIIRPHPSESRQFWRDAVGSTPGVEIHDSGVATPWILAAACLVHHGCTTGIEAELLGKPHIMYAPHRDDHHDSEVMKVFAPTVRSEPELRAMLGEILDGGKSHAKSRAALEEFYASLDGPLVCERMLDEFDRFELPRDERIPDYLGLLRFSPRHLVASYWPRSAKVASYARQKWQGTDLQKTRQTLTIMREAAGLASQIGVSEIFPQLFHVSRNQPQQ